MGFGTLFIGYFLILNFAFYFYTDAIAAVIMLLGLYKLSAINRPFKYATYIALGFTVFGVLELILNMYGAFAYIPYEEIIYTVVATVRYGILLALSVFMLNGMIEIADEVGLPKISKKSMRLRGIAAFVYTASVILEASSAIEFINPTVMGILSIVTIFTTIVTTAMILIEIYRCYMKIYMPGEEKNEKQGRGGFMEKFEKRQEEAAREYAEYKLEKFKKKTEKRKKNK